MAMRARAPAENPNDQDVYYKAITSLLTNALFVYSVYKNATDATGTITQPGHIYLTTFLLVTFIASKMIPRSYERDIVSMIKQSHPFFNTSLGAASIFLTLAIPNLLLLLDSQALPLANKPIYLFCIPFIAALTASTAIIAVRICVENTFVHMAQLARRPAP